MPRVIIDPDRCKGCSLCVYMCPKKVLELDKQKFNKKGYTPSVPVYPDKCIGCAICAMMCPDCAITVIKEKRRENDGEKVFDEGK